MMRTKFLSLFTVAALSLSGVAWSAPLSGLYETEVAVADQSAANQPAAMSEALRQVVVKLSGQSAAASAPALNEALRNPARYVEQYSYRNNDSLMPEQPLLLGVAFDHGQIDQLLRASGLTPWSSARPLTSVWLAVEQGGQRILVGSGDRGLVKELLVKAAQRRGLPLRLPLLDATDKARVQPDDVWNDNSATILQASQRYEAQAVLVGRLGPLTGGRWQVRWTLYQGGTTQRWSQTGDKVAPLVAYGIDAGTDTLAALQSTPTVVAVPNDAMYWVVKDVRTMHDHRRVMDYLASVRGVTKAQLEQVNGDTIRVRITAPAGDGGVQQQLANDNRLIVLDGGGAFTSPDSTGLIHPGDHIYRLAP